MRKLILLLLLIASSAYATDGWQSRPSVCANIPPGPRLERCQYWVQTVQRPDIPGASCCGPADAYMVDWETINGELWITVIGDYPPPAGYTDEEGNPTTPPPTARWITRGYRAKVPPEKMVTRPEDANQSPHAVAFMNSAGQIFCVILGPLI